MPPEELQMLLEQFLGGPVTSEQVAAFREAVDVCSEYGMGDEIAEPGKKGKGVDLAVVFGGGKPKGKK